MSEPATEAVLVIPPWISTVSIGDGLGHHYERNSEGLLTY